jgi:hypothetical protein
LFAKNLFPFCLFCTGLFRKLLEYGSAIGIVLNPENLYALLSISRLIYTLQSNRYHCKRRLREFRKLLSNIARAKSKSSVMAKYVQNNVN